MSNVLIADRTARVSTISRSVTRGETWRRLALGTALASGVLVVNVVGSSSALAQIVTTDTTGALITDRRSTTDFTDLTYVAAFTGFGVAPQNTTAAGIKISSTSMMTVLAGNTPTVGGSAAVSITAAGGALQYDNNGGVQNLGTGLGVELKQNGAGTVILNSAGAGISSATDVGVRITSNTAGAGNITSNTAGITAGGLGGVEVTSAGTASNISMTSSGLIEVAKSGGKGISATLSAAAAAGTITVTANGATQATGAGSTGIVVSQAGSGLVTVTAKGGISSKGAAGTLANGIDVQLAGTSTAGSQINVTGNIGGAGDVLTGTGVNLVSSNAANASKQQVTITNASVFSTGNAINVIQQGKGDLVVTGTGTGTISAATSNGIFLNNLSGAAGNLTVDVTQAVDGKIAGIQATTNGSGNIDVKAGGNVTGNGGGVGILVGNTNGSANAGTISVSLATGKTLTAGGIGISVNAGNITGATAVTADGAVTGATQGIKIIHNGTNGITVGGTGNIKGSGGAGIDVLSTGKLLAGSNILINGSGSVTGTGANGIDARILSGASAGDIIIQQSGSVSGAIAISAFNVGLGKLQVVTTGAVTATGIAGIAAQTATGDALVTVGAGGVTNSGGAGVFVGTNGGNIKVDGTGTIETTKATDNAMRLLGVGATGGITVSGSGNTIAVDATAADIQQVIAGNKGAILFDRTGTVTGGNGIVVVHAGTDAAATVTVQTTGAVSASTGIGIQTTTFGGLNTVTVGAGGVSTKSGTFGVSATSNGTGNVLVNGTGLVNGGSTAAVSAVSSATGTGSVTVSGSIGVKTAAANGSGIIASIDNAANANAILVNTSSDVSFGGGTGTGINAKTAGIGNVTVSPTGNLINLGATDTGTGINAKTTGAGQIVVTTKAGTAIGAVGAQVNKGIVTNAGTGTTNITVNGNIFAGGAGSRGVDATGSGTITVTNNGFIDPAVGIQVTALAGADAIVNNNGTVIGDTFQGVLTSTVDGATKITNTVAPDGVIKGQTVGVEASTTGATATSTFTITNNAGATITGVTAEGVKVTAKVGDTLITNAGTITGGTTGVLATATSGKVTVSGAGTITGTGARGIDVSTTLAGGVILIDATGPVTGGTDAISAVTTVANNVTVTGTGTVLGKGGAGIIASSQGGNVTVAPTGTVDGKVSEGIKASTTLAGTVTITPAAKVTGATNGIDATTVDGLLKVVNAAGVTGGTNGIIAVSTTGGIDISGAGPITGTAKRGIDATTGGAVIITSSGTVTGGTDGISAVSTGANAVTVTGTGTVLGNGGAGIIASSQGGNVTVAPTGTVDGKASEGIKASTTLAGTVTITPAGAVSGATNGVDASTVDGLLKVVNAPGITGGTNGILAVSKTGGIDISGAGAITGTATRGIDATTAGTINIVSSGPVTGGTTGIAAISTGASAVNVVGTGAVIGKAGSGIAATSQGGDVLVTPASTVTGAFQNGILASTTVNGKVTVVTAGQVTGGLNGISATTADGELKITNNGGSTGLTNGISATSTNGAITIDGAGATEGTTKRGIDATTGGAVTITSTGTVTGGTDGISAVSTGANAVTVTGTGTVLGKGGAGVIASSQGGDVIVTPASTVEGKTAEGIKATTTAAGTVTVTAANQVIGATTGIFVTSVDGAATVTATGIKAGGPAGISVASTTGAVAITSNAAIENTGGLVTGLTGTSAGNVTITNAGTIGAIGPAPVNGIIATTTGADKTAKVVNTANVTATALGLSVTSAGAFDVSNSVVVTAPVAARVAGAGALGGTFANSGTLSATTTGFEMASTGKLTLNNSGTITGPTAISTTAGTLTVSNTGTINGQITTAGGIANITNSNVWNNVKAGGPATSTVTNLTNTGTLNMVNGATGDTVTATGTYTGGGASTVIVDVDVSKAAGAGRADTVTAAAGAGSTQINFAAINPGRVTLTAPIDILTAPGATVTNLGRVANLSSGLFGYSLIQSAGAPGTFQLTSTFNSGPVAGVVSGVSGMVTSLQAGFHQPASAIISRPDNCGVNQLMGGPFIRMNGGDTRVSNSTNGSATGGGSNFTSGTTSKSDFKGVQGGFDTGLCNINGTGWNIHAGLMGGFVETSADTRTRSTSGGVTDFTRTTSRVEVPFFGAYAFATLADFTAEFNVRKDWYNAKVTSADEVTGLSYVGPQRRLRGTGMNFNFSSSYRFWLPANWYIEPSVGLSSGRVSFGSLPLDPALFGGAGTGTISLGTSNSLLGRIGVNVGAPAVPITEKLVIVPFAHAALWREFGSASNATAVITTGGAQQTFNTSTSRVGNFAQVGGGLQFKLLDSPLLGFIRGDVRFGKELQGKSLNAGVRLQF